MGTSCANVAGITLPHNSVLTLVSLQAALTAEKTLELGGFVVLMTVVPAITRVVGFVFLALGPPVPAAG